MIRLPRQTPFCIQLCGQVMIRSQSQNRLTGNTCFRIMQSDFSSFTFSLLGFSSSSAFKKSNSDPLLTVYVYVYELIIWHQINCQITWSNTCCWITEIWSIKVHIEFPGISIVFNFQERTRSVWTFNRLDSIRISGFDLLKRNMTSLWRWRWRSLF